MFSRLVKRKHQRNNIGEKMFSSFAQKKNSKESKTIFQENCARKHGVSSSHMFLRAFHTGLKSLKSKNQLVFKKKNLGERIPELICGRAKQTFEKRF